MSGSKKCRIKIYTLPTCPHCLELKEFLQKLKVQFEEVDVSKSAQLAHQLAKRTGQAVVPVTELDDELIVGFDPAKIKDALQVQQLIKGMEAYANSQGFKLNPNREWVKRVMKGLLANEQRYGARYCPCRTLTGDPQLDKQNICPCAFHRAEIEQKGSCLCGLFIR